jgi:hypothetical protein
MAAFAYTNSIAVKSVFGNIRVAVLSCTATANSGYIIAPGIGCLFAACLSPISMNSGAPKLKINLADDLTTTANGKVAISGCTSGDVFYVTMYGRS